MGLRRGAVRDEAEADRIEPCQPVTLRDGLAELRCDVGVGQNGERFLFGQRLRAGGEEIGEGVSRKAPDETRCEHFFHWGQKNYCAMTSPRDNNVRPAS